MEMTKAPAYIPDTKGFDGEVKLAAITMPVVEYAALSTSEFIAFAARVSNPGNQNNTATAPKLLKYLLDNHHYSPFEMVSLTMEIQTTRDISRQILRHRSFSFQEFSQRYAVASDHVTDREARLQDTKNRQNSFEVDDPDLARAFEIRQEHVLQHAKEAYDWALKNGIAKEQARALLPEGLTRTTLYMAGTLRSWIHYCKLRCANGTQKEHMEIARKCRAIILNEFPDLTEYLSQDS